MRNARRNQIILWSVLVFCAVASAAFAWVLSQIEPRHRLRWLPAVVIAAVWVCVAWMCLRDWSTIHRLERELREAGVEAGDEERIPIRLAANRQQLVAGVIFFVLLAATFVAYYAGWFGGR